MQRSPGTPGIHHVTAIAGDAQGNVDFYSALLGLRLVKRTVNFDDPGTYHLYYGDELGQPGTILTFFPWPGAPAGRPGTGQTTSIALAVPAAALTFWQERLAAQGIDLGGPAERLGEPVLAFHDPDELSLELIGQAEPAAIRPWATASIPAECAIRGVHSVTLGEATAGPTASFLTGVLGFEAAGSEGSRRRFRTGSGAPGTLVDVVELPGAQTGHVAVGTIHHVAWRAAGDPEQAAWQTHLAQAGTRVTPVRDRQYFRSIYFHEPGGVLFEIATDPPGFGLDERPEELGTGLRLPPWLEARRSTIEQRLPPLMTDR